MLIDDNLVFLDNVELKDYASGKDSEAVPLNALFKPGKQHEPICMIVQATEKAVGAESLVLKLQESDTSGGSFTDVPGAELTIEADSLVPGENIGWRFLPSAVTKPWVRLNATATSASAGKIFAAIVREDVQPYSEGMYINAGKTLA